MKKVLASLLAMMFVCGFALSAGAQEVVSCGECNKCDVGNVPCPETIIDEGPQGSTTTSVTESCPFDYDGDRYTDATDVTSYSATRGRNGSWGYVTNFNFADDNPRNCKVLFDICECPEACEFVAGQKLGIRMVIETPGVYFADPNMDTIYFDIFSNSEITNGIACNTAIMRAAPGTSTVRNFGDITYYRTYTESVNEQGITVGTVSNIGTPIDGCFSGNVSSANKVVALESSIDTDYLITMNDTNQCHLWIDIPAMRLDGTAQRGAAIKVRIILLYDRVNTGLCEECHPPITCECSRTVGIVCAGETSTDEGCLYFPYVLQGIAPWQAGIVLTSKIDLPSDAYCEFTLKDAEGNKATYKNTAVKSMLVFFLDDIMANFTGTLIPGAASLTVKSNYSMDGYSFLTDGNFGAGTLPRGCTSGTCCP